MAVDPKYIDVGEAGLRVFEFIFTLLAFALMASAVQSTKGDMPVSLSSYAAIDFLIVANVLAWLYSSAQIAYLTGKYMFQSKVTLPIPQIKFLSFIFDQIFTVLLLASSSAGAATSEALKLCNITSCCSQVRSSLATGFMATFALYLSAALSVYIYVQRPVQQIHQLNQP